MHNMLNTKTFFVALFLTLPMIGVAQHRAVLGPVEKIDLKQSSITVLGQKFVVTDATRFAVNGVELPSKATFRLLSTDRMVYVEGLDPKIRSAATSIILTNVRYVPGATEVYVVGPVEEIFASSGRIRIGDLRVDTTSISPDAASRLGVGSVSMFSGIQPVVGGMLIGPIQVSVRGPNHLSVGGSGSSKSSVGGSGASKQSVGGPVPASKA